jgi:hypothetical protein
MLDGMATRAFVEPSISAHFGRWGGFRGESDAGGTRGKKLPIEIAQLDVVRTQDNRAYLGSNISKDPGSDPPPLLTTAPSAIAAVPIPPDIIEERLICAAPKLAALIAAKKGP